MRLEFHVNGPVRSRSRMRVTGRTPYGPFPSLNDVIDNARANPYGSNREKRRLTELVARQARDAADGARWHAPDVPVRVALTWHEPTMRRDADNVASAAKFVLDGLVEAGVLRGDSRRWVPQPPASSIVQDADAPGVDVEIETVEEV